MSSNSPPLYKPMTSFSYETCLNRYSVDESYFADKVTLDLGTGASDFVGRLSGLGHTIYGVDIVYHDRALYEGARYSYYAADVSAAAKDTFPSWSEVVGRNEGELIGAMSERLPFRDVTFDLVTSHLYLGRHSHTVAQAWLSMLETLRCLKVGGEVMIAPFVDAGVRTVDDSIELIHEFNSNKDDYADMGIGLSYAMTESIIVWLIDGGLITRDYSRADTDVLSLQKARQLTSRDYQFARR